MGTGADGAHDYNREGDGRRAGEDQAQISRGINDDELAKGDGEEEPEKYAIKVKVT